MSLVTAALNSSPYFDDFTPEQKDFLRVLFKPGYAVQSRELTQTQTILQNQIYRFGQHIFKEGSRVLGGKFSTETDISYVKVEDVLVDRLRTTWDNPLARSYNSKLYNRYVATRIPEILTKNKRFIKVNINMENTDRKSTRLNSSHSQQSRMPSSA